MQAAVLAAAAPPLVPVAPLGYCCCYRCYLLHLLPGPQLARPAACWAHRSGGAVPQWCWHLGAAAAAATALVASVERRRLGEQRSKCGHYYWRSCTRQQTWLAARALWTRWWQQAPSQAKCAASLLGYKQSAGLLQQAPCRRQPCLVTLCQLCSRPRAQPRAP